MNVSNPLCSPTDDAAFGPIVGTDGCRGGLDFTLLFEQSMFVFLPASLLLVAGPVRLLQLNKAPVSVAGSASRHLKLATACGLASLQFALIILWIRAAGVSSSRLNSISLAGACVSFASSLMLCALSYSEHARSPRPSSLLNVFLFVSVLLDAALVRTLWLSATVAATIRAVFTTSFAFKALLLVLEARGKSRHLVDSSRDYAPEETSGLYGRAVFAWVTPLLRAGFRKQLRPEDLFPLDESMSAAGLNEAFWMQWNKASSSSGGKSSKYRLITCCAVTLRWPIAAVVFPRLILLGFTICQPLVLNRFLIFLDDKSQHVNVGYGLIVAYGIVYFGIALAQAVYWHGNGRFVTMLRGVLVSAVFCKTTELSTTAVDNAAAATLMSTDVDVIGRATREINEFWANVLQIAIGTWLLSSHIGYAAVGPIIVSFAALVCTLAVSPAARKCQVRWLDQTQKRVGITVAMIGHIKSIKMSGLSHKLTETIDRLRLDEIKASRPFRTFGSITASIAQVPVLISPPVAFALYHGVSAHTGKTLDATKMFASLSYIILLAQPLFWMFEVILDLSAALAAFERIQKHLVESSRKDYRQSAMGTENTQSWPDNGNIESRQLIDSTTATEHIYAEMEYAIEVENGSFSWTKEKQAISNISFKLHYGAFAIITGPIASGKTSFLKGLLGEIQYATGNISLAGNRLSWCDQNPWILNQTVRDNIIGYDHFERDHYDVVIKACELQKDFTQLHHGDATIVGSKGLTLSGGQKQRIALARAIYSRPQTAIFDDVFSGLDNHTARRVFKNLFGASGLLRNWGTTIVLATQSVHYLSAADCILVLSRDGSMYETGTFEELQKSAGYVSGLLADIIEVETSQIDEDETDANDIVDVSNRNAPKKAPEVKDDKRRQLGDSTVYRYYFGSIGATFFTTLILLEIVWAFLSTFPSIWLKFWADANEKHAGGNVAYYLGTYTALQVTAVLWHAILIWFVLIKIAAKSGISLHTRLLHAVMKAPLSMFASTDLGSLTTRFSQDVGMIDKNLPLALVVSFASFFILLGKAGLLAASSYYVSISYPFLAALYYYLQQGYLRTSRQLRFLDLEEKAPVYTQFLETLAGLSTIRAFGWSKAAIEKNHQLVDRSQRPFYLLIMVQRWLVLVLDLTTACIALLIVGFSVHLRGSVSVALTGVALVELISLSETLNMLIQFWTSIETSIGAVARIKQFSEETPAESLLDETHEPPRNWPSKGHVVIDNLQATYGGTDAAKALDGISLEIKPGEKVGICGRTGSGKSSLMLAILRLLDVSSGSISIDSVPLSSLPRETIRGRLIAVTQDQFVLPGTVRENIDPNNACSTQAITEALQAVDLWNVIEERGGLDEPFSEDILSQGQKQLFSLARAMMRKNTGKVLLLDEATSSVDRATEEMVHRLVTSEFEHHSVIAIAHRLETVVDFDKVVVLDSGRVAEVGEPRKLLKSGGAFKSLWEASRRSADSSGM